MVLFLVFYIGKDNAIFLLGEAKVLGDHGGGDRVVERSVLLERSSRQFCSILGQIKRSIEMIE
jgi:hypothetical protein